MANKAFYGILVSIATSSVQCFNLEHRIPLSCPTLSGCSINYCDMNTLHIYFQVLLVFFPLPTKGLPTLSVPMLTPLCHGVQQRCHLMGQWSPTVGETATSPSLQHARLRQSLLPPAQQPQEQHASFLSDTRVWCTMSVPQWIKVSHGAAQASLQQVRWQTTLHIWECIIIQTLHKTKSPTDRWSHWRISGILS